MELSYYVDEGRDGAYYVIERLDGNESVVGAYRFVEDAEEHLARILSK